MPPAGNYMEDTKRNNIPYNYLTDVNLMKFHKIKNEITIIQMQSLLGSASIKQLKLNKNNEHQTTS